MGKDAKKNGFTDITRWDFNNYTNNKSEEQLGKLLILDLYKRNMWNQGNRF